MSAPRILAASINGQPVGRLEAVSGLWSFTYEGSWLREPHNYPLSPHLPLSAEPLLDGADTRPVQWFFDNLLPEEGQRSLLAADAGVDAADAFGLLAFYGAESAGALTLLPPQISETKPTGPNVLTDAELSARIGALPKAPLTRGALKRMSLAGAQHKLAVVIEAGALYEPVGPQPSTHILKPDHPDADFPHSVINEWFSMRLAAALGLRVPNISRRYVPQPIYLIERFDRDCGPSGWLRRHAIDACQLLNLDRLFKYERGGINTLAALAKLCRSPALARTQLFNWLIFNLLIGNSDTYLKNLSFVVSHSGIGVAPFYDLLSVAVYDSIAFDKAAWPHATTLAWPILGVHRFSEVTRSLLIEAAAEMGINRVTAERLIERQRARILPAAIEILTQVESAGEGVTTPPGEQRCLRAITHTVIREMLDRLQ